MKGNVRSEKRNSNSNNGDGNVLFGQRHCALVVALPVSTCGWSSRGRDDEAGSFQKMRRAALASMRCARGAKRAVDCCCDSVFGDRLRCRVPS